MNIRLQFKHKRQFPLLLTIILVSSFAVSADGQRLPPSPLAFPMPSSQAPPASRMPIKPVVKVITKAQLNQDLIVEAYRRDAVHAAGLLAQGADPNARDKTGTPVLLYAVAVKDNGPVISLLLSKGANVNARNVAGFTPLGIATAKSDVPALKLLLAHGADPKVPQQKGLMPLVMAVGQGNPETVRLLIEAGAPVNASGKNGSISPLSVAAASVHQPPGSLQREAVLLELLDHGADANTRDQENNPTLLVSASQGDLVGARLLIEHGAKVNVTDKLGRSALMVAAAQGNAGLVRLLLTNSAAVNSQDTQGFSALVWAARFNHTEVVRALLQAGAQANLATHQGFTPLMAACWKGNPADAKLLLGKGARVGAADRMGNTALMLAAHSGNAPLVEMLLSKGADANARTSQGATALSYAAGHKAVFSLLLSHIAAFTKSPLSPFKPSNASVPIQALKPLVPGLPQPALPVAPAPSISPIFLPGTQVPGTTGTLPVAGHP